MGNAVLSYELRFASFFFYFLLISNDFHAFTLAAFFRSSLYMISNGAKSFIVPCFSILLFLF